MGCAPEYMLLLYFSLSAELHFTAAKWILDLDASMSWDFKEETATHSVFRGFEKYYCVCEKSSIISNHFVSPEGSYIKSLI